jgi:hypothetical protein
MAPVGLPLPTFLHGKYAEVKKACRAAAARVVKGGASLVSLPEELGGWIDVGDMPGGILVRGPTQRASTEAHYQGYVLPATLTDAFPGAGRDPGWDRLFDEIVQHPWLIYCCLGQDSYHLFKSPERARRFAVACRDQWRALNLPGRRFLPGGPPAGFWRTAHTLGICLGRIGAPEEDVKREKNDPALADGALPPVLLRYTQPQS